MKGMSGIEWRPVEEASITRTVVLTAVMTLVFFVAAAFLLGVTR